MTDLEYVIDTCKKCIDSGFGTDNIMFYYKVLKVVREKALLEVANKFFEEDFTPEGEKRNADPV